MEAIGKDEAKEATAHGDDPAEDDYERNQEKTEEIYRRTTCACAAWLRN